MSTNTRSRNRIPPLLQSVIRLPPEASLLLLTGVLDATPHWLVSRFISSALSDGEETDIDTTASETTSGVTKVLLVSWMRDWEYWRNEVRRGAGLDLARLANEGRFGFVDGLTGLFGASDTGVQIPSSSSEQHKTPPSILTRGTAVLPHRSPAPTRTPATATPSPRTPTSTSTPPTATQDPKGRATLVSASLPHATETIDLALSSLQTSSNTKVLLILDSPTLLLSTTPTTATSLSSFLLSLREKVHSTILLTESDTPFISASNPSAFMGGDYLSPPQQTVAKRGGWGRFSPLEKEVAAFVASQGHGARLVMGTRGLETGVARDVSGVLRVGRGGGWDEGEDAERKDGGKRVSDGDREMEMEVLYHVAQDGSVRVFERGGGDVG
ncbi:hypothetical protein MBLNU457_g2863t1 [Dothideomycetes sp. NU457]